MNLSPETRHLCSAEDGACPLYLTAPSKKLAASGDSSLEPNFTELSNPGALGYDGPGLQRDTALPCTLSRN